MKLVRFTRYGDDDRLGTHIWVNPSHVIAVYEQLPSGFPAVTIIRGDDLYFEVTESLATVVAALEGAAQ